MMERAQQMLVLQSIGLVLLVIILVVLLHYVRSREHALKNPEDTKRILDAIEGVRMNMSSNHDTLKHMLEGIRDGIIWIKSVMNRFFHRIPEPSAKTDFKDPKVNDESSL